MKKVVVIGSGIAGTTICNELSKYAEVTLIEKGQKDVVSYPNINHVAKKLAPFNTFCFSGGGGSNLWHNGLIPIGLEDVVSPEFLSILKESEVYTDQAAEVLNFKGKYTAAYTNVVSEMNIIAKSLGGLGDGVDCLIYPLSYSKLQVHEDVNAYYEVDDISFESENSRISGLRISRDGKEFTINTDLVVISTGTFSSPQLVEKVVKTVHSNCGVVGRGLIDHPAGFVGKVQFANEIADSIKKFASAKKDQFESCTGIRIKSDCGQYTCFAFLRPAFTMGNSLPIYQYKSRLGGSSGLERVKNAISPKLFHPDILSEVISHVFKVQVPTNKFNILVYFQQHQGKNNVQYQNNEHRIDWDISDEELDVYNGLLQKLESELLKISKDINIQIPITKDWLRSGAHHSGTIKVGGKELMDVDTDLKLNGCDNVYVCDGSIIQEHSYANTGLTISKLALRLCNKLKLMP